MAEKEKSKKSLFGRVVDAHTGGKLRHLKAINLGQALAVSPQTSPRVVDSKESESVTHIHAELAEVSKKKVNKHDFVMSDTLRAEMTHLLLESVSRCSRQKMRYILMILRRMGGVDGYMSYSDLSKVLQDNGLFIPSTASGMMLSFCSDQLGVDSEKVWKLLMEVHNQSDRDSVRARKSMHVRAPVITVFADSGGDRELLERMESEMLAAGALDVPFDMNAFKTAVFNLDKTRHGIIPNTQLLKACRDFTFPVKGDLLKSLLIRCDDDNNGKISHREFFVLIDKAYDNAAKINPRLFQKREEPTKKRTNAGQLLDDGKVIKVSSAQSSAVRASTLVEGDEGAKVGDTGGVAEGGADLVDLHDDSVHPEATTAQSVIHAIEEVSGKNKSRKMMGRMKGFLGRKKGQSGGSADGSALDLKSVATDNASTASSIYSSVTRSSGLYNRGDVMGNGIAEKPIHPVVRKIGDTKMVLWPPDEYFDAVTPKTRLPKLEWIYGYSGFAHRNNIHMITGSSSFVYFVGYVVVVYDLNTDTQRLYVEHDGPVQCLTLNSKGEVAASGQSSTVDITGASVPASVRLWNTDNLHTLHVLKGGISLTDPSAASGGWFTTSVAALAFTKEDGAIIAIDESKARVLSVWLVATGALLCHKPCTESPTICGILPLTAPGKDHLYILYGRNLMEVWRIIPTEKRIDFVRQCVFGNIPKPSVVTFVIETGWTAIENGSAASEVTSHVISGDSEGNVILWSDDMRPKRILQAATKIPVFGLCNLSAELIMGGARDGQISLFHLVENSDRSPIVINPIVGSGNLSRIPEEYGGIRMLLPLTESAGSMPETFIVGTTANCILHVVIPGVASGTSSNEPPVVRVLTAGHFDAVNSICNFEDTDGKSLAISAGMDGNLTCYDLVSHKIPWRLFLKESMVTALDCYSQFLAVGTTDGILKLYQMVNPDLSLLLQANVGQGKVSCVKFSPDGTRLAVGSQESEIYMYKFIESEGTLTPMGKFDKHDYPPVALDWSRNPARDNHFVIHSNSYECENLLWDAENMDFLEEAHFYRNIKWNSQSCVFGFAAVTSVTWERSLDGHVVCTEVSPTLDTVAAVVSVPSVNTAATGSQKAERKSNIVGLYSFPNANIPVVKHMLATPSSGISALRFCYVNNRLHLLCAHDLDGSISQWTLL